MELQGLVLEANMWSKARLKKAISTTDTYFSLADNIGFDQVMVGDIIIMDRVRNPEQMLVNGFDEENKLILVQRGYNGTPTSNWKKGAGMRIFRILNAPAVTESRYEEVDDLSGSTPGEQLTESYLVYEWQPQDTCLPGCFYLEFKLLKMKDPQFFLPGGKWTGTINIDTNGDYYTGTEKTDGSVKVTVGIADPTDLIRNLWRQLPSPLYLDPDFVEPVIPTPEEGNYYLWRLIEWLYPSPTEVQVRWKIWDQLMHLYPNGTYYNIPYNDHWVGPTHLWSDGNYYTGSSHTDGSVYLDRNGVAPPQDASYNGSGMVSILCDTCVSTVSVTPSFTGISQTPSDFGCNLGSGVEWVRRFPVDGEGFLIRITDSPTQEM